MKKIIRILLILMLFFELGAFYVVLKNNNTKNIAKPDYTKNFNRTVIVVENSIIYHKNNDSYETTGMVYTGTLLKLKAIENEYYLIEDFEDDYYIKYYSVRKIDNYYKEDKRYKKYIPFNINIITNEETTFYKDKNKVYTINKSFNLPVIINDEDKYYVEYNNMLLYVLQEDVKEVIENSNTKEVNTKGIPVLNYHFVYKKEEEKCTQEICHPEEQFRSQLKYIKENGYFTPNMKELDMYIDGKLQLPKSVVITLDDGRNINLATKILEEYQLNATAFIVTGRYDMQKDFIKSDYVEWQSHSHNLHDAGTCPPGHGQGGGLTCLSDDVILADLKTSKELLGEDTIAFCYPFYEYNSHSIELLKKAGFKMAFSGEYAGGKTKVTVGADKFRLPRWVIVYYLTEYEFEQYVKGSV